MAKKRGPEELILTRDEVRRLAPLQAGDERRGRTPAVDAAFDATREAVECLRELLRPGASLHLSASDVDDSDPDDTSVHATYLPDCSPGVRARHSIRATVEEVLSELTGRERPKACLSCGAIQNLGAFCSDSNRPDGKSSYCRKCSRQRSKPRRKKA